MKRRRVVGGGAVTKLPDDIIFEILIRVSCATSLWEFRSVCKSWCSLISSPNFIQAHLNNSLLTSNFVLLSTTFHKPTKKIIPLRTFLALDGSSDYYSSDDYSSDDESDDESPHIPIPNKYAIEVDCPVFKNYDDPPQLPIPVISTCNGLCLMLVNQRDFYLWNPFTKQVRKLPDFLDRTDLLQHPDDDPIIIRCGAFGFDDRSHDYNIVAFVTNPKMNTTKFYSLKTDSWTRLQDFQCSCWYGTGQFLNGEVHWLILGIHSRRYMMVSLDLSSQVQRVVDFPNNLSISLSRYLQVGGRPQISVHGGCLYVLCRYKSTLEIWVLEDTGVPDSSWVMVATIRFDAWNDGFCRPKTNILCMTKEGRFLLSRESQDIVVYEPKSDSCMYPFFRKSFPHADICIQSLVSPFPDGMVKNKSQTRYNASELLTCMKGSGQDTQGQANAGSATTESQNRSSKRTKSQMALPTRQSPPLSSPPSTVYLPASSGSSLRRSPRLQHPAPPPSSSSSLRRSTRFRHLTPSPSMAEQDCPGSRL